MLLPAMALNADHTDAAVLAVHPVQQPLHVPSHHDPVLVPAVTTCAIASSRIPPPLTATTTTSSTRCRASYCPQCWIVSDRKRKGSSPSQIHIPDLASTALVKRSRCDPLVCPPSVAPPTYASATATTHLCCHLCHPHNNAPLPTRTHNVNHHHQHHHPAGAALPPLQNHPTPKTYPFEDEDAERENNYYNFITENDLIECIASILENICAINNARVQQPNSRTITTTCEDPILRLAPLHYHHATNNGKSYPDSTSSIFFNPQRPALDMRFYIAHLVRCLHVSKSVFVVALIYLDRVYAADESLALTDFNVHRLITTAILVACKFLEDEVHRNSTVCRIGGVPSLSEMNQLEKQFLRRINWNCSVNSGSYDLYRRHIFKRCRTQYSWSIMFENYLHTFTDNTAPTFHAKYNQKEEERQPLPQDGCSRSNGVACLR